MKRLFVLFLGAVAISTACVFPSTAISTPPPPSPMSTLTATLNTPSAVSPTPTTAFGVVGTPSGSFSLHEIHPAVITLQTTKDDDSPYVLTMTVERGETMETIY